jgi:hypothetical protein
MVVRNSSACIRSGLPPPYSSIWISTSAALAAPRNRGIAQVRGSASFKW